MRLFLGAKVEDKGEESGYSGCDVCSGRRKKRQRLVGGNAKQLNSTLVRVPSPRRSAYGRTVLDLTRRPEDDVSEVIFQLHSEARKCFRNDDE